MRSNKKLYIAFVSVFIATCSTMMAFNFIVDPFGTFGDNFLKMYGYNMSENIRIAKTSYIDKNHKKFDSYIIGGSKSGSLLPATAEKYYPSSKFYNLNMIGGRFYDYEHTIYYLVNNYEVKNIILQISQLELNKPGTANTTPMMLSGKLFSRYPLAFYAKFLFQNPTYSIQKLQTAAKWDEKYEAEFFYQSKDGSYNRTNEEKQIQNNSELFFKDKSRFPDTSPMVNMTAVDYNLKSLGRIVDFCKKNNVKLLVIAAPTYKTELETYSPEKFSKYLKDIANITEYWNFSGYNSVNIDKTNFYDKNHFREKIGDMMLARVFDDRKGEIPVDFGKLITADNAKGEINQAMNTD